MKDRLSALATIVATIGTAACSASPDSARGIWLAYGSGRRQACAYHREAARLAERSGNSVVAGRALMNLADCVGAVDPASAVDAARAAAGHLRRTGDKFGLVFAVMNLSMALVAIGDWDAAADVLIHGLEVDGLSDSGYVVAYWVWLAALRGDVVPAESIEYQRSELRKSEDPQDQGGLAMVGAFVAEARREPAEALRLARIVLSFVDVLGVNADSARWAWPLAARCAHELGDAKALGELLAVVDAHQPGEIAGILSSERHLVRARMATGQDADEVTEAFAAAIDGLRTMSTPYHVAHGLLDHAEHLAAQGDPAAAATAVAEARQIGERLRCQPLIDRVTHACADLASLGLAETADHQRSLP